MAKIKPSIDSDIWRSHQWEKSWEWDSCRGANGEEHLDALFFLSVYTLCTWGFVNLNTLKICFWSFTEANYTNGKKSDFMLYVFLFFFFSSCPPGTQHHRHLLCFYFCYRVKGHFFSIISTLSFFQTTLLPFPGRGRYCWSVLLSTAVGLELLR